MKFICIAFAFIASVVTASERADKIAGTTENGANPIRKVVTMLEMMINKIEAQGKKEKELFDKYMCYCETSDLTLTKSIEEANTKIPQLESEIKEAIEHKATLETELSSHMGDRDAAKTAMAKATAIREKEHAAFLAEEATDKANIEALAKAITAIGDGMAGGFLQSSEAQLIRQLSVGSKLDMLDVDRQMLVSFLSGTEHDGYIPKSGEILGILKQLKDEMDKDLAEMTATENAAAQTYEELMAAKKKELETLNAAIEHKLKRTGELGVEIAMKKNDLEDTKEALGEDTLFLADLVKNCGTKKKEWEAICKTRSEELIALRETIKILNDDDALELFKKTLPSASFLQIEGATKSTRLQALKVIQAAMKDSKARGYRMDFIEMALRGKKQGFEKVIKLIDDMVVTLNTEQADDDHKKEYCEVQFDMADDKKKELELAISDIEKVIAETTDALGVVIDEIKALEASIHELDKSVVEATEQRKDEHADYSAEMANNNAAKELILFAKNRMQKFYNPKLYKPPPKRELSEEERITLNMGGTLAPTNPPGGIAGTGVSFVQVHIHQTKKDAPPPPPEAAGAYKKKGEESAGVLQMMDLLVAEVDKEMTEAEVEEKDAQGDYEKLMMDSAAQRAGDSKLITEKTAAKAEMETELQAAKETKQANAKELKATMDYISSLHTECDFLIEYYQVRKEARASEIDALKKAKAILSGADFSLMQTSMRLRGTKA
jgi:DNA repair exonuclease SbcCD ATPase subunit